MSDASTYAWRAAPDDPWIEIAGPTVLPGAMLQPTPRGDVAADWRVTPGFVAALTPEHRSSCGFVAVQETERPASVRVLGSGLGAGEAPVRSWLTEDYTEGEVNNLRAAAVGAIKIEAGRRILARYEAWRQANMTARAVELTRIGLGRAWTQAEEDEAAALEAAWAWIKDVRAASDTIEAALPASPADLSAFDIAGHPAWPAPPG